MLQITAALVHQLSGPMKGGFRYSLASTKMVHTDTANDGKNRVDEGAGRRDGAVLSI
jgi:hypothetical protein